jgi:hypothetical protein
MGRAYLWPLAGILVVAILQFTMVFTRAINGDEFYHYSLVVEFARGTLTQPLQTFYVRLFQWLTLLPGSGVDHIVDARVTMFACELATVAAIAKLAAKFVDRKVGLLCALAYLSAGFVVQHGFSFRFDPVDAALLMGALCVLACTSFRGAWVLVFAALVALAAVYTIKCVLYAPAFLGIAWLRWSQSRDKRNFLWRLVLATFATILFTAILLFLHAQAVAHAGGSANAQLQTSAEQMFRLGASPLYARYILKAVLTAPLFALLILVLPVALMRSSLTAPQRIAIAGLWLPIGTLVSYQNTAPYFYVFILPPVAVACSIPMARLVRAIGPEVIATTFVAMAVLLWTGEDRSVIDRQRRLIDAADTIFPSPVPYFASGAMLAQHEKANPFMTPWGTRRYLQGQFPSMRDTMRVRAVPLLFASDPIFIEAIQKNSTLGNFLPEDVAAMRETYLPFWGPIWVAGKIVAADESGSEKDILVPGPYSVTGGAIEVDGKLVREGDIVELDRGIHRFTALDKKPARLTWGRHLRAPAEAPPPRPYRVAF